MSRFSNRSHLVLALALITSTLLASASRAAQYKLDKSHTAILFGISHLGYSYTYGRFNDADGAFTWDSANPAASQFQFVIPVASIDSNDKGRDDHLRNADFFNASQFPHITFKSTSVKPAAKNNEAGNMYDVTGNFTMHGQTKQITLPMKKLGEGAGPYGKYRTGFFCQTTIKRSEYGMTGMLPAIGDDVAITISFEGLRQGEADASRAPAPAVETGATPAPAGPASTTTGSGSSTK